MAVPGARRNDEWRWTIASIVLLAIVIRLAYIFVVCRWLQGIDPRLEPTDGYNRIAENLHAGLGYRLDSQQPLTMARPPAYPLFLLGIFSIAGVNYALVQVIHALLGGLTCWLLFLTGRWVKDERVGALAALLFALYPNAILYSARLYAENLYFPLFVAFAYALSRAAIEGSWRRGLITGALWGLSVLTRGTLIALPLVLPFGILLSRKHRAPRRWIAWSLPALAAGILALSPWIARNAAVSDGAFVPSSSWAWVPMYCGTQVARQVHRWTDLMAVDQVAVRKITSMDIGRPKAADGSEIRSTLDELAYEKIARKMTLDEWRADPLGLIRQVAVGAVFVWFFTFDTSTRLLSLIMHGSILCLIVAGAWLLARRWPESFVRAWPILGLLLFTNAFYALAYPHVRYMAPAIAAAFVFAAVPLSLLIERLLPAGRSPTRAMARERGL